MFDKILVAIDGSADGEKALAVATDLALRHRAELLSIGVAEMPGVVAVNDELDVRQRGESACFRQIGEAAVKFAQGRGVSLRPVVARGHAADAIVRLAESEQVNLIVIGGHGQSSIGRFFLGSISARVSECCHCSVLIVK